ncbi:MAG TPA: GIY-YIG nuclease family protein [Bacteroidia bacterium]
MKGYMYILRCSNGAYYTGSTKDLDFRLQQHQNGEGANFTKKHLPVELVYYEEFQRIDEAFYREKQVQGWGRAKKEALIACGTNLLHTLSECKNETHYRNAPFDSAQGTVNRAQGANSSSSSGDKAPFDSAQGANISQGANTSSFSAHIERSRNEAKTSDNRTETNTTKTEK